MSRSRFDRQDSALSTLAINAARSHRDVRFHSTARRPISNLLYGLTTAARIVSRIPGVWILASALLVVMAQASGAGAVRAAGPIAASLVAGKCSAVGSRAR